MSKKIILLILFCISVMVSCSVPIHLILYNNSNETITILSNGEYYKIESKISKEVPFPYKEQKLNLTLTTNKWKYEIEFPPRSFEKSNWEIYPKLYFQFESNGWIYILYPTNTFPATDFPSQPKGYPLKPKQVGRNSGIVAEVRHNDTTCASGYESGTYYYHYNHRGDVIAVSSHNGGIIFKADYDAYGKITRIDSGSFEPRYTFSTKRYFKELGLYYYGYRWYLPELGRWTTKDPIGYKAGNINVYKFCGNRPTFLIDNYGLWQVTISLGWKIAGSITFGSNNGRRNFGIKGGYGFGASLSIDPNNKSDNRKGTHATIKGTVDIEGGVLAGAIVNLEAGGGGSVETATVSASASIDVGAPGMPGAVFSVDANASAQVDSNGKWTGDSGIDFYDEPVWAFGAFGMGGGHLNFSWDKPSKCAN